MSASRPGAAPRGASPAGPRHAAATRWHRRRTYHHGAFPPERLAREKVATVSVCLPARDEAQTIGRNLRELLPLLEMGAIDQLVVVDDSRDGTAEIARRVGAEVYDQSSLAPELGPVAGKGDAIWRALTVLRGEVICFLDADSEDLGPHFACGLAGPVLFEGVQLAKAFYRRPFSVGGTTLPEGGGRVSELMARPLLNAFFPDLTGFHQPLAGELAARRDLLERLPFATGYGIEIAMLIDACREVGLDALAQVDLDVRQNQHRPLHELTLMAYAVLRAVTTQLERDGRLPAAVDPAYLFPFQGELVHEAIPYAERPPHVRAARR